MIGELDSGTVRLSRDPTQDVVSVEQAFPNTLTANDAFATIPGDGLSRALRAETYAPSDTTEAAAPATAGRSDGPTGRGIRHREYIAWRGTTVGLSGGERTAIWRPLSPEISILPRAEHGLDSYKHRGCRCEVCRASCRAYNQQNWRSRRAPA